MKLYYLIKVFVQLYFEIVRQKKFIQKNIIPFLDSLERKHQGKFPEDQRKKIIRYYSIFIPVVLCHSFKNLTGKSLSVNERLKASYAGILTPVYDDLFEYSSIDQNQINQLTLTPQVYTANGFHPKVIQEIQSYLIDHAYIKEKYLLYSHLVMSSQFDSLTQKNNTITQEAIQKITFDKGGYSVLLFFSLLDQVVSEEEVTLSYLIGSNYQLCNDIFDIYKDVQDGIYTLANTYQNLESLKAVLWKNIKLQKEYIDSLPYSKSKKEIFKAGIHLIPARAFVALNVLIKRHGTIQDPKKYWTTQKRESMIVDMEYIPHVVQWIKYCLKI